MSYHGLSTEQVINLAERGNPMAVAAVAGIVEHNPSLLSLEGNLPLMLRMIQFKFHTYLKPSKISIRRPDRSLHMM